VRRMTIPTGRQGRGDSWQRNARIVSSQKMMRWQIDVWKKRPGPFSRKATRCVVCRALAEGLVPSGVHKGVSVRCGSRVQFVSPDTSTGSANIQVKDGVCSFTIYLEMFSQVVG
jgi:hypothetical protein